MWRYHTIYGKKVPVVGASSTIDIVQPWEEYSMTRMLFGLAALCSVLANVPTAHAEDDLGMQLRISATKDCSKETLPAARADCQTSKIMALDAYGHRQGIKASCNTGLS